MGVDNTAGPNTRAALDGFRASFREAYGETAGSGPIGVADWSAFFRLFQDELAPARATANVAFAEPPTLACGERYPIDQPNADHRYSASNRRVEILFLDSAHAPDLAQQPPGESIYSIDACTRRYLPMEPADGFLSDVHIALRSRSGGIPLAKLTCALDLPDGTRQLTTDDKGVLCCRAVLPGDYTLRVQLERGELSLRVPTVPPNSRPYTIALGPDKSGDPAQDEGE